MAVVLTHINAALTRTGNEVITSIDQNNTEAKVADRNYENIVREELSTYQWRFATTSVKMNQIAATPHGPWTVAFQLPTDPTILVLRTVKSNGTPIDYEKQRDKILCNQDGNGVEVVAHYTWRVPEDEWPPFFAELITQRMEVIYLRAIGERYNEAADRETKIDRRTRPNARRADGRTEPGRDPHRHRTLEARNGTA